MTISSENRKAGPFPGNGVATSFPFAFKVFGAADLLVVQTDIDTNVETELSIGIDYAITLNPDQDSAPGGSIDLPAPLPIGQTLTATSALAYLQPVELTNQGGFYPDVINSALDRLTIFTQQLAEGVRRAVKVQLSSESTPDQLLDEIYAVAADAAASAFAAAGSESDAAASANAASISAADAANSAASISLPPFPGAALNLLRVKADESGYEHRTPVQTHRDIGGIWSSVLDRTATFTVDASYAGALVHVSGSFSVQLPASSTVWMGFSVAFRNYGVSHVLLNAESGESIGGYGDHLIIRSGDVITLVNWGGGWTIAGRENNVPAVGWIIMWPRDTAPAKYLECAGQLVSRTAYPELFDVLGIYYSAGDGSTTFGLPDYRGVFPRGWDHGRGIADVNRDVGVYTPDAFATHNHLVTNNADVWGGGAGGSQGYLSNNNNNTIHQSDAGEARRNRTTDTGGAETYPKHIIAMFCIRAEP